eukprot:4366492-Pyramimonas_sp.AAC.2
MKRFGAVCFYSPSLRGNRQERSAVRTSVSICSVLDQVQIRVTRGVHVLTLAECRKGWSTASQEAWPSCVRCCPKRVCVGLFKRSRSCCSASASCGKSRCAKATRDCKLK